MYDDVSWCEERTSKEDEMGWAYGTYVGCGRAVYSDFCAKTGVKFVGVDRWVILKCFCGE